MRISLQFVPKRPNDNISALVQIMARRRTGGEPLFEAVMSQVADAYRRHSASELTNWGRVTHICVSKLTNIGSNNGLSPSRRQAIIWTNAGTLSIGPLGMNFSEIVIEIDTFSFKKLCLKMSAKWWPSCLGLNVLKEWWIPNAFLILNHACHNVVKERGYQGLL